MKEYQIFKRIINYYETDKMQVVHHSNYVRYLEECRMDLFRQLQLDYEGMEQRGIMIPVLSVKCNYRSPARFGETICIIPKLERFTGVKFEMSYRIYSEDCKILHNEAESSHCFVDSEFRPIRVKRDFADIYGAMKALEGKDLFELLN